MAPVVVAHHGEAVLQGLGHAVPHLEVTTERVAQNEGRALALLHNMEFRHGGHCLGKR